MLGLYTFTRILFFQKAENKYWERIWMLFKPYLLKQKHTVSKYEHEKELVQLRGFMSDQSVSCRWLAALLHSHWDPASRGSTKNRRHDFSPETTTSIFNSMNTLVYVGALETEYLTNELHLQNSSLAVLKVKTTDMRIRRELELDRCWNTANILLSHPPSSGVQLSLRISDECLYLG